MTHVMREVPAAAGADLFAADRELSFVTVLDRLPEAVVVSGEGRVLFVNRAAERLFGYGRRELLGRPLDRFLPDEGGCVSARAPDALDAACALPRQSVRIGRHRSGELFRVRASSCTVAIAGQLLVSSVLRRPDADAAELAGAGERACPAAPHPAGPTTIIGRSKPMQDVLKMVALVADSRVTVLIQGESGTGKELIAREIHRRSPRRERPFVAINCAALAESLLESELFGHVKGAFTGAVLNKKGLFEEANGGTLFLDEIAETSLAFQAKLLRTLEDHQIRPVGAGRSVEVDVRLIAATNKDLGTAVEEKTFRQDLAYRLAVVPILVPPLRCRDEDIPELLDYFMRRICEQSRLPVKRIPAGALQRLVGYHWPGNVRELENLVERAVLLTEGEEIDPALIVPPAVQGQGGSSLRSAAGAAVELVERERIVRAMHQACGNRSDAARLLHVSRATLYNRLRRYGLLHGAAR